MGASHSLSSLSNKKRSQQGLSLPQGLDRAKSEAILRSTRSELSLADIGFLFDDQNLKSAVSVPCIYHHLRKEQKDKTFWPLRTNQSLFLPEFPIRLKDLQMYQVKRTIGKGAFGKVLQVETRNGRYFALKQLNKSKILDEDALEQCKEEMLLQLEVENHPFILGLESCWQSRCHLYFLTDYMDNGDLYTLWRKWQILPSSSVKILTLELALALEYLHDSDIIFRDLKLENILIDSEGHVKLTDFGLAKQLADADRTYTICGTLRYMAPEVLTGNGYSFEADWWSLGILAYVLLMGEFPFSAAFDHIQMYENIRIKDALAREDISEDLQELLRGVLNADPQVRLCSLDELKGIHFFAGIDIDDVYDRKISPLDVLLDSGFSATSASDSVSQTEKLEDFGSF